MSAGEYLAYKFGELDLPGLSCSVSYSGNITDYNFGVGDLQTGKPVDEQSVFNIASIGKLITIVSVFKLIEGGRFNLSTPLVDLLHDLPAGWNRVQVGHLLSHSSGIKNYTDAPEYWNEYHLDVPRSRIISYVADAKPKFAPGTQWGYSNTGFYLLGLIIERISGKGYFEFCTELIRSYRPGLMIIPTDDRIVNPQRVRGYTRQAGKIIQPPYYSNSGTFSAGGFSAVLHDFIDFESAIFRGEVLSDLSLKAIIQPYLPEDGSSIKSPDDKFDFVMTNGMFRFENSGRPYLAHRGEIFGFTSEYRRMIKDDFSIILAANADWEFDSGAIIEEVYRLCVRD
ncbi:serine hydrolase domain-containing protein [Daejeonella sp. JGW-45]|uniref:serine hydrolase domain-containing protein n=1 Tax=Daejeonella sp. JGW-45 TaxID=3034148 RepID=UPI0023EC1347|nr:serine hydrolase domain-containing protein [Daejeonella sp. JGW-45]